MAIYDTGTASLAANGRVTGVGTQWAMPLTLIRVGATIIFKTNPLKIYTISEITSDTSLAVYNPKSETVPAGTGYAILAHDGISVQGLAQDVAETLRYYQSKETSIQSLIDFIGQDSFDWPRFEQLASQSVQGAANALASQIAAAESASTAVSARNTTTAARDQTIDAINNAGDASTLVTLAGWGIGNVSNVLGSLDFQTFNFIVGGNYRVSFSNCTNVPTSLIVPSNSTLVISVEGGADGSTASRNMQISTYTTADNNFRRYSVSYQTSAGNRNYFVRESIYLPGGNEIGGANDQRVRDLLDVYAKSETLNRQSNFSDLTNTSQARTNLGLGSVATLNTVPIANGGTGATSATQARTNLGLGSVATLNTVPIANGGTGASNATQARANLGLLNGATYEFRTGTFSGSGTVFFGTPFPNNCFVVVCCAESSSGTTLFSASVIPYKDSFYATPLYATNGGFVNSASETFRYIAIGN